MKVVDNMKNRYAAYQELDSRDKRTFWKETLLMQEIISFYR